MPVYIYVQETIIIGEPVVFQAPCNFNSFALVFEDDGETGYLYGCDDSRQHNRILDALHIYNVSKVSDRHLPSEIKLGWSEDGLKGLLMLNNYPHAVLDFAAKRGYCRSNFPPPRGEWTENHPNHEWDEACMDFFR